MVAAEIHMAGIRKSSGAAAAAAAFKDGRPLLESLIKKARPWHITARARVLVPLLTLLSVGAFQDSSVLLVSAQSPQTDEFDLRAVYMREREAARELRETYYPGRSRDEDKEEEEPEGTLNLLNVEVKGAQDLRPLLEDKDITHTIYKPNEAAEKALNELMPEDGPLLFASTWETESEDVEVEMKRGRFLGVSHNAIVFEVTTAENDALFIMKMGIIDHAHESNTPEKAAQDFLNAETVLSSLLPEETAEMLLTRGLVVPLAVGKLKNLPDSFPLIDAFDSTNSVALYPMVTCTLRYLIDNDLLITDKAKMYFTVRVLSLVAWLHAHGVIHLDVRPEHMLVTADGHGFLGGMENSAPVDTMVKTKPLPGYVAPEMLQLRKRKYMGSSWHVSTFEMDAWATGYTIYQIWCRQPAFNNINASNVLKVYRKTWGKPWDYSKCGRIPTIIVGLIDGLLAWEEEARLLPVEIFEERLLESD